jgi:hypothetical protein
LGGENIYEPHDVGMGMINDFGANPVFLLFLSAVTKTIFRGLPKAKRVRYYAPEIVRGMIFA